jgi:hypothetical protein
MIDCIGKKKSVRHGGLHWRCVDRVNAAWVPHGDHTQRVKRLKRAARRRNVMCVQNAPNGGRTLPTAGFSRERERPDVDIPRARTGTAYGIPGVAEVKANTQRALTSAGYIIYLVQQNQTPIHRKTPDRLAAVENPKKHRKPRPNAQKPSAGTLKLMPLEGTMQAYIRR